MDPLTAALALILGYTLGKGRRKPRPIVQALPRPECDCGHARSYHTDLTGKCNYSHWDPWDAMQKHCTCLNYDGPIPLPEVIAAEEATER
jgi:hypothetical protein